MDSVWEKSSSNSSAISTSKLSCVCARYHRIRPWRQPWSKLHKKHQPLGNARKLWLAMVGGSDTPWLPRIWIWWRWQFWFVFFFSKKLFFWNIGFFITKQLLLEETCYSILVNISCDGNTFQLQFLCFFSVLTVKYNQLSTIAPLRSGLKWWKTRRWAALLGSCVWNSFLNLFAEK